MKNIETTLEDLYNLRSNFLVIGLTGRQGSGCSTVANILSKKNFIDCKFPKPVTTKFDNSEERKYNITHRFLLENWSQFTLIRASDIIVSIILQYDFEELISFLKIEYLELLTEVSKIEQELSKDFNKTKNSFKSIFLDLKTFELEENVSHHYVEEDKLSKFSLKLKDTFQGLIKDGLPTPFQKFGDNIRKSGNPYNNTNFDTKYSYTISYIIKQLIKQIHSKNGKKSTKIVIDSIRNSFEARYFRERYSAFYLFAITTENEFRVKRLGSTLSQPQIKSLDTEYDKNVDTKESFYCQDIKACIQMSDVYLNNPDCEKSDSFFEIKTNILRYLSLISQPGIITPTPQERTMQIAYTAKYNSGCISRQVGAVVTDPYYSVKSIGWNNTPEGQTPCLLRNAEDLVNNVDDISFSKYEKTETIKEIVEKGLMVEGYKGKLRGKNLCFCFKQVQNSIDSYKNQVHTRSLHAEENAMLQISKYGGGGIKDGILFTSASPCELCSKKAYQMGIKEIFYIDPYPGIATANILKSGTNQPILNLFTGAVGKAYHAFFEPFMAYKDELEMILEYDFDKAQNDIIKNNSTKKSEKIKKLKKAEERIKEQIDALEKEE
jgi:deoxycytidylate deaminase